MPRGAHRVKRLEAQPARGRGARLELGRRRSGAIVGIPAICG